MINLEYIKLLDLRNCELLMNNLTQVGEELFDLDWSNGHHDDQAAGG